MISTLEVDDWLRGHTRMVSDGFVWPRGTKYDWATSRKIVHTYLSLGLEPNEAVTIDLVDSLVHRLEVLEQAVRHMTSAPVPSRYCSVCAHEPHGADRCGTAVPTAEGRVCRCNGLILRPRQAGKELDIQFAASVLGVKTGDVIREGDPRMNLVQDLIEGDAHRQDWARHMLSELEDIRPENRQWYIEQHPYRAPEGD